MGLDDYKVGNVRELLDLIERGLPQSMQIQEGWKQARDFILLEDYTKAESILTGLTESCETPAIWNTLTVLNILMKKEDSVKRSLFHASEIDENDIITLILWGDFFSLSGIPKIHDGPYKKAKELYPDEVYPRKQLVTTYFASREFEKAYNELIELTELAPDDDMIWSQIGIALIELGNYERAERELREYSKIHKHNFGLWYALGNVLAQLDKWDEAEKALRRALQLNPDSPNARVYLGNVFRAQGRIDAAIRAYRKATVLDPTYFVAWMNLGMILMDQKKDDEAREMFERAYDVAPERFLASSSDIETKLISMGMSFKF